MPDAAGVGERKRVWASIMGEEKLPSQEQRLASTRDYVSDSELADLRDEQAAARACGVSWRDRGLPGPPEDDPHGDLEGGKNG